MPIYEYECEDCGSRFEVRHGYSDPPQLSCSTARCKGKPRRVFSPPAIIFKGKGFHITDYGRGNGKAPKPESPAKCDGCAEKSCPSPD